MTDEIERLREKSARLTESIYSNLSSWQIVQVARHPQRPYASDYISRMFTDWEELHGDRHFGDDKAIIGGIGRLNGRPVVVIGEEKGRSVQEKVARNFGMPKPEGYRKALRLMNMAERFKLPVLTLIDTPGAYPGIDSEERGISEANAMLVIEGVISVDDYSGGLKMRAEGLMDLAEARLAKIQAITILWNRTDLRPDSVQRLKDTLAPYNQGACPVALHYERGDCAAQLRFGAQWRVKPTDDLLMQLRGLYGQNQVRLVYR